MTYPPKEYYSSQEETKETQKISRILSVLGFVALVIGVLLLGI